MPISNSSKNAVNHLLPMDTLYLENYDIEARKLQAREVVKSAKAFIQILKLGYSYLINASQKTLETNYKNHLPNATGSKANITETILYVP